MKIRKKIIARIPLYLFLIVGSVLFSFPFFWMIFTSMKVDRELFPERLTILPAAPFALPISPFVDHRYYKTALTDVTKPHLNTIKDFLYESAERKKSTDASGTFEFPEFVDRETLVDEMSKGLAKKLEAMTPPEIWEQGEESVDTAIRNTINNEILGNILDNTYRRFLIGRVTVRSIFVREEVLLQGKPISERFRVVTPETVSLHDMDDKGTTCALVQYDFTKGDSWKLEMTGTTKFDLKDFQRLQIYMRADDNWHQMNCYVEKLGVLYKSVRPVYMANFDWFVLTYQEPGLDDLSNKIRTWVHIKEIDCGPQYVTDPHTLKITLEMKKTSRIGAWIGKATRNYYITNDHIPIVRYFTTSVYLVILNIILSVFSCSLVAYAIARLRWPGRDLSFLLMLATLMIPVQVTMIPSFLVWKYLHAYNTLVPLWLGAGFAAPFNVFLLRQFLKGIPRDLEEAARIDGATHFHIYWHIMLPLVKPTLIIIAIGAFLGTWNNFIGPLIYISDQRLYPLAFGLYAFSVQVLNNPALTMAGSFVMAVPVIVAFFFAQKYFIQGITLTGLKG